MRVKFLTVLVSCAAALPIFNSNSAQASVHKILISKDSTINPETGSIEHKVLNPSGEVAITFTKLGLNLEYVTSETVTGKKQVETLQVYIEFPALPDADNEKDVIRNALMQQVLESQGKTMLVQMLRKIADNVAESGGNLVLLADSSRVVGFQKDHVTMDNVTLLIPNSPPTTLAQLLFNLVSPQVEAKSAAIVAEKYKRNPFGFMDGLPRATVGGPKPTVLSCEALFISPAK